METPKQKRRAPKRSSPADPDRHLTVSKSVVRTLAYRAGVQKMTKSVLHAVRSQIRDRIAATTPLLVRSIGKKKTIRVRHVRSLSFKPLFGFSD